MEFGRKWIVLVGLFFTLFFPSESVGIRRYETDLFENDFCGHDMSVYSGKCKKIKKCVNLLTEKKVIEVCSFSQEADETLVCCSRDDFYKSRSTNNEGPLDYETCLNQYKDFRNTPGEELAHFTVNGVEVGAGEFPHITAIGWLQWNTFAVDWNCAGSLITLEYVLTAAHCTNIDSRKPNVVRLGDIDLISPLDDTYVQQFGISNIIKHPSYDDSGNDNDIALIRINGQVVPTQQVVPACIVSGSYATEYFEAAGYGQDGKGFQTNKLSKVFLKMFPSETCQASYDSVTISDTQICAQNYRDDLEEQDTCYGDSGAALQYINTNHMADGQIYHVPTIVGVTSFGIGCASGHPSVYARVSKYIDWLESVIMP